MNTKQPTYAIAITFCDEENNGFVNLGGAGWDKPDEWHRQWEAIPASPLGKDDPAMLMADKLNEAGDIDGEKFITVETAEMLLGKPLDVLISEGRANTAFTLGQLLEREPELAADFAMARQSSCSRKSYGHIRRTQAINRIGRPVAQA